MDTVSHNTISQYLSVSVFSYTPALHQNIIYPVSFKTYLGLQLSCTGTSSLGDRVGEPHSFVTSA